MARHLHKYVRNATRKAFEHYGFAYAEILARWREIVGEDVASFCAPERIRWPRLHGSAATGRGRKLGGTLVIRVTDGRAVELQHDTSRIIDRVNTYYGYEAITGISFVQGRLPIAKSTARRQAALSAEQERDLEKTVGDVDNEDLRRALTRLGRGALGRNSGTQGA